MALAETLDIPPRRFTRRPLLIALGVLLGVPIAVGLLCAAFVSICFGVCALSFVWYPVSGFVTIGVVGLAAPAGAVQLHRRGPRGWAPWARWGLRLFSWLLVADVIGSCWYAVIVARFINGLNTGGF